MDQSLRALLAELEATGRENDSRQQDWRKKMLNLDPETAQVLALLVRLGRRTRLLEIGTSNGYSTIWLAWAARAGGGRVASIERDPWKRDLADANLRRAGLRETVELVAGGAAEAIANLPGPFDFVFFDADRHNAPAHLARLLPKLTPDALLAADNTLSHAEEIAGYVAAVEALPGFDHVVLPVVKGLSLAHRSAAG